ncbi:hypothetical protein [Paenibacillus silvisoli]|uniref:hypothetical protein n=1 Tax=Paenibacillus silvisoli TaxID=3110539 RepID=UPI002804A891|nr:hypothetical protein [Paenibacillus silvisoli]
MIPKHSLVRSTLIMVSLALIFGGLLIFIVKALQANETPRVVRYPAHDYQYSEVTASGGFALHVIKSDPSNLTLQTVRQNITLSDY